jgi:hypothetical protein
MENAHIQHVPAQAERLEKLDRKQEDDALIKRYQSLVGSLNYAATCTRPDIAYAVSAAGAFNANPGEQHMTAAKRILRFLKGTAADGLQYRAEAEDGLVLVGFADADWAGDTESRKSTGGYVFMLAGGTVSWSSRRQQTVALSSTEAEFMALSEAVQEALYLRRLLADMGATQHEPTKISEDNQSCMAMAKHNVFSRRSKHIDTRYKFVKEAIERLEVCVQYMHTSMMPADCLTKPVGKEKLSVCRAVLMHTVGGYME